MYLKYSLILILLLCINCKPDSDISEEEMTKLSEEDLFFRDYEAPRFKWGFVDSTGKLIIKNTYDNAREFEDGLAAICKQGKWGYIDHTNTMVIQPQFRSAFGFHEGIARVQNFDKQYFFIDKRGQSITDTYAEAYDFSEGKARVKTGKMFQYLGLDGKVISDSTYYRATDYNLGYASIAINGKYGLIDKSGKIVIPTAYSKIYKPYTLPLRAKRDGKVELFYSDKSRSTKYTSITPFVEGLAMAKDTQGHWHLINENIQVVKSLDPKIDHAEYAECGLWRVARGSKLALMDLKGGMLTDFIYNTIYNCKEDRLGYEKNGLWGFMSEMGNVVVKPSFPLVWDFYEGKARVILERGVGFVDPYGKLVIPPDHIEVRDFHEGLARVQVYEW